jgi:hypothetical protein
MHKQKPQNEDRPGQTVRVDSVGSLSWGLHGRLTATLTLADPRRVDARLSSGLVSFDLALPEILSALNEIALDYDEGNGIDFESYEQFLPAQESTNWFRLWTGNPEVTGAEFRIFGQDGTGGYAALWLTRSGAVLSDQPVVFLGSEGACGVVARNLADYLWLVAGGYGPMEAIEDQAVTDQARREQRDVRMLAERVALSARKSPAAVLISAQVEFPDFEAWIESLVR